MSTATRLREWWFRTDEIDARWLPLILAGIVALFVGVLVLVGVTP